MANVSDISLKRIAILIAVKNPGQDLDVTLASLSTQTSQLFNVYLFNGGDKYEVNQSVSSSNVELSVFKTWEDTGLANAWNRGLLEVKEDWVILLNAGDLLHCNFIYAVNELLSKITKDTVLIADVAMFDNGQILKIIKAQKPNIKSFRRGSVGFAHPGMVVHKHTYSMVGSYNEKLKIAFDSEWILRAWVCGVQFERHSGLVYMEKGGMSDKYFGIAIHEFFNSVLEITNSVSSSYCKFAPVLFKQLRPLLKIHRNYARPLLRNFKHHSISLLNFILCVIPISKLRRAYLRLLGFTIGKNVSIGYGFKFYNLGNVIIGDNVVINRNVLIDNRAEVVIEDNVNIARDVTVFTAGHDIDSPFLELKRGGVTLKRNVFIFSKSIIMPGVVIGENSIVFPGSIVTRSVQSNIVVSGSPAKFLKAIAIERLYINDYDFPSAM